MKWITARHLAQWADRIDARSRLSEIAARLVRASATNISSIRFPSGDSAQIPGYDGRLVAVPATGFERYLPQGNSVWEFGTTTDYRRKANGDFVGRTANPGPAVVPGDTTFVFVTPRSWPDAEDWAVEKRKQGPWKDIRVLDGLTMEDWLELCPAAAAAIAREIVGTLPASGAYSLEEFWEEYSSQFRPRLTEEAVLAGRADQADEQRKALLSDNRISRLQGDSIAEVLAFVAAVIRKSEPELRKFLESRALVVETPDAARQLAGMQNLIFLVRGAAVEIAGRLTATGPVIVPLGRESLKQFDATRLRRPSVLEMSEALRSMALTEQDSQRLARECDRSVTILARRIPSATARLPKWHTDQVLIPALLAGVWDSASEHDRDIVAALARSPNYESYEAQLRLYLIAEDAPLEREGSIWSVRAPVDVFAHVAPLLGTEHMELLRTAAVRVFGEVNPALDLPPEDRPFARLRGATAQHSKWLRDGIATTLLIIAALGEKAGVQLGRMTPQGFVDAVVAGIPGLRDDHRIIASLSDELPLLMEAAPDPLLATLEHLLEGAGERLRPIFQDARTESWLGSSSPHAGLLWALGLVAWDPVYLSRAASVLTRLGRIDPGGSLSSRPANSLAHIFLPWHPETNARLKQRLAVLDQVVRMDAEIGWNLLVRLLPRGHDFAGPTLQPRFREAGASEREVLTRGILLETYHEVIKRGLNLAGVVPRRWAAILDLLHAFRPEDQDLAIDALQAALAEMPLPAKEEVWKHLSGVIRHHTAHSRAQWSLAPERLASLETIANDIAPKNPVTTALWLFTERLPEIEFSDANKLFEEVEARRRKAVETIWRERGLGGILDLAASSEAPRYAGFAFGQIVMSGNAAYEAVTAALIRGEKSIDFGAWLSAAARGRFGEDWRSRVAEGYRRGELTSAQAVRLVLTWPHSRETWVFVDSLGEEVATGFWESKQAWGMEAGAEELQYAIQRYLSVDRPELVVDALGPRLKEIPTSLILKLLDQFESRIAAGTVMINNATIGFDVQQIFAELQSRSDVALREIATREYKFLPLLRRVGGINRGSPLAIDKCLAEDPELFVQMLCDVFRPALQRQREAPAVSEEQQIRARWAWELLEGFIEIPGRNGDQIDANTLKTWVAKVRELASAADRLEVAEQRIGAVLAHAPMDPQDNLWPHKVVRDCLEELQSGEIERGIQIERFNMRGVTTRGYREGGDQERKLATQLRDAARELTGWPRIQGLLLSMAQSWEEEARREDLRARQDELRD